MSTKLDAEGLAIEYAKRMDMEQRLSLESYSALSYAYAAAIREHSQPLADELAAVKAERDELLAVVKLFLKEYKDVEMNTPIAYYKVVRAANEVIAKYPKP